MSKSPRTRGARPGLEVLRERIALSVAGVTIDWQAVSDSSVVGTYQGDSAVVLDDPTTGPSDQFDVAPVEMVSFEGDGFDELLASGPDAVLPDGEEYGYLGGGALVDLFFGGAGGDGGGAGDDLLGRSAGDVWADVVDDTDLDSGPGDDISGLEQDVFTEGAAPDALIEHDLPQETTPTWTAASPSRPWQLEMGELEDLNMSLNLERELKMDESLSNALSLYGEVQEVMTANMK